MNPNDNPYLPHKQSKLPVVILALLFILSLIFGLWAFGQMMSYKNDSDKKVAAAVDSAKKSQATDLQKQYDEQAKSPYVAFKGSPTYGSLTFNYPKSWNVYDGSTSGEPINAYFFAGPVPNTSSNAAYPLRVELTSNDYSQVVQQFDGQVSDGSIRSTAFIPPKMNGVANVTPGVRLDGAISSGSTPLQGSMVIIKLRDKTLQIYTLSKDSLNDFNNTVLPSLSFIP